MHVCLRNPPDTTTAATTHIPMLSPAVLCLAYRSQSARAPALTVRYQSGRIKVGQGIHIIRRASVDHTYAHSHPNANPKPDFEKNDFYAYSYSFSLFLATNQCDHFIQK